MKPRRRSRGRQASPTVPVPYRTANWVNSRAPTVVSPPPSRQPLTAPESRPYRVSNDHRQVGEPVAVEVSASARRRRVIASQSRPRVNTGHHRVSPTRGVQHAERRRDDGTDVSRVQSPPVGEPSRRSPDTTRRRRRHRSTSGRLQGEQMRRAGRPRRAKHVHGPGTRVARRLRGAAATARSRSRRPSKSRSHRRSRMVAGSAVTTTRENPG